MARRRTPQPRGRSLRGSISALRQALRARAGRPGHPVAARPGSARHRRSDGKPTRGGSAAVDRDRAERSDSTFSRWSHRGGPRSSAGGDCHRPPPIAALSTFRIACSWRVPSRSESASASRPSSSSWLPDRGTSTTDGSNRLSRQPTPCWLSMRVMPKASLSVGRALPGDQSRPVERKRSGQGSAHAIRFSDLREDRDDGSRSQIVTGPDFRRQRSGHRQRTGRARDHRPGRSPNRKRRQRTATGRSLPDRVRGQHSSRSWHELVSSRCHRCRRRQLEQRVLRHLRPALAALRRSRI